MITGSIRNTDVKLFGSFVYTNARYTSRSLSNNIENLSIVGKEVEGVPDWINRASLEVRHKCISLVGVIPSYTLFDFAASYRFLKNYHISGGVNNIADLRYFRRRINMYPGPGILPADGRTFYVSLGFKI